MPVTLSVHGAARTVTGSCYLLETRHQKFLVDCGMFQGAKTLKALNYEPFPFDAEEIDFVLLTHAHIDHAGLIPKLVKHGFKGPIYATQGSIDLLSCMLPDSGHIQEFEVEQLNRRNARRGREAVVPIYTVADAEHSLLSFKAVGYDKWFEPCDGVKARYWNAGHILGSASIEIEIETRNDAQPKLRMLFSGDIGTNAQSFHPAPDSPGDIDYLICESTYGGRSRAAVTQEARHKILETEVNAALKGGRGALVIPAFAVERTQELLADLAELAGSGRIPRVPIFLDSPLAIQTTQVFLDHADRLEGGETLRHALHTPFITTTESAAESMRIEQVEGSHIIIAASGMCEAGRIRHHLKNHLWRANSTVMLVGYQAEGTLGKILSTGAKSVRIQGEEIKVKARIRQIDVYSGHADGPALLQWISERGHVGRALLLVHGEESGMDALESDLLAANYDAGKVIKPMLDDVFDLMSKEGDIRKLSIPRRLRPEVVGRMDWHNDLSSLWLDISDALDKAADDRARNVIIRRLRRAFEKVDAD